jgi:predicted P-loop ATPase
MCEFAAADKQVKGILAREKQEEIRAAFNSTVTSIDEDDPDWTRQLRAQPKTGQYLATIDNVWIILEHDPNLKNKFELNKFAGRGEVLGPLPWCKEGKRRLWEDNDNQGLYWYLEKYYQITANSKTDGALSLHSSSHSFNEVTNYLQGLTWDGKPRLDTLFIDYLGAEDTTLIRAMTRKTFVAAVARAMRPGTKFDNMLILSGPQGLGKSTLIYKMSRGWFNDSIRTFEGKDASELLQGVWLVEIAELQAFRTSDISRIKQFVSQQADRFRAAYGRHVQEMPRCCIFFGTTNSGEYLRDRTGNRRFWPVDVGLHPVKKSVFSNLDSEVNQLWAEALAYWRLGEPLYLTGDLEAEARATQEDHREASVREGLIQEFVSRKVPEGWSKWKLDQRRAYWGGGAAGDLRLVDRDKICALEVWCEAMGGDPKAMKYLEAQEINDTIASMPGWIKVKKNLWFGIYGAQKGFEKA